MRPSAVGKVTGEEIVRYFDKNLEALKSILGCAEKSAKIRKSEEKCEDKPAHKAEVFI